MVQAMDHGAIGKAMVGARVDQGVIKEAMGGVSDGSGSN